jgi:hypothetical protein
MPRQIDNLNSKEYINSLRSEILAKITDEWKEKWAKNHGATFTEISNLLSQDAFFEDLRLDIGKMLFDKLGNDPAVIKRNPSTDTFGRFFDENYEKSFTKNTLDILAQYAGYEDFTAFKNQQFTESVAPIINVYTLVNSPREISEIPKYIYELPQRQKANRWRWLAFFSGCFLAFCGYYYWFKYRPFRTLNNTEIAQLKFEVSGQNNSYNPSQVSFDYDFSQLGVDSLKLSFADNRGVSEQSFAKLTGRKGTYKFDFYKPGLHFVEVRHLDQMLKRVPVYVKSHGWACWYNRVDWINTNYAYKRFYNDGILFLHPEKIANASHRNDYIQIIRRVEDFDISTDSLTLEYDIKSSPDDYAISCYTHLIQLAFNSNKRFSIGFGREGCSEFTPKNTPPLLLKDSQDYNLSFPHIFYEWTHLKVSWKNKRVKLWLDDQLITDFQNNIPNGKLIALNFDSKGSAMYDNVRISNSYTQKAVFEDDFNTIPKNTTGY